MLSENQKKSWGEDGFLVLRNFIREDEIEVLQRAYDRVWEELPSSVVVDDLHTNRRTAPCLLSPEEREHRFKVNDLYLESKEVRDVVLSHRIVPLLRDLLGDHPVLCNTLSLNYGTQQAPHADSLFMTPVSDHKLVATWIAMEDGNEDSGPLSYYPGSHNIPIYRFSSGKPNIVVEEFPKWEAHIQKNIKQMNLRERKFIPKKGDMFIWSAQLIHGGSEIKDTQKTRKSIVSHFFSLQDTMTFEPHIHYANGGFWQGRPAQSLTPTEQKLLQQHLQRTEEASTPGQSSQARGIRASLKDAYQRYGRQDISGLRRNLRQSSLSLVNKARALLER